MYCLTVLKGRSSKSSGQESHVPSKTCKKDSNVCLIHHMASFFCVPLLTRTPVILVLGPILLYYDPILTNYICNNIFWGTWGKNLIYLFRGHNSTHTDPFHVFFFFCSAIPNMLACLYAALPIVRLATVGPGITSRTTGSVRWRAIISSFRLLLINISSRMYA